MSLEEWRAEQPVRPLISVGNGRTVLNEVEVREYEDRQSADAWAQAENGRRHGLAMAAMLPANRVAEVTPDEWPGYRVHTVEEAEEERRQERLGRQRRAIANAMGIDVADVPEAAADRNPDGDRYYVPGTTRTGADTAFRAEHPDLPAHKPGRPSQRVGARRRRWLTQLARENGTTVAEQARLHPERPRKNVKGSK